MSRFAIKINNLTHQYLGDSNATLHIPQWQIECGKTVFLYGDSGSGKSTLLNLLSGILAPSSGSIEILGHTTSTMNNAQKDSFRANHIGVVFQTLNLIPYLSVLENIKLASYFAGKKQDVTGFASELMAQLKLAKNVLDKPVNQLSIGQQQRVAIARALVNKPQLLLVDEPTSALDASARDAFMTLLVSIAKQNQTSLIFVSHDQALQKYFDQTIDIRSLQNQEINA